MEQVYKIGKFTFGTLEEKKAAAKELYYINAIKDRYDFENPKDAKKVATALENSGIIKTYVGQHFLDLLHQVIESEQAGQTEAENTESVSKEEYFEDVASVRTAPEASESVEESSVEASEPEQETVAQEVVQEESTAVDADEVSAVEAQPEAVAETSDSVDEAISEAFSEDQAGESVAASDEEDDEIVFEDEFTDASEEKSKSAKMANLYLIIFIASLVIFGGVIFLALANVVSKSLILFVFAGVILLRLIMSFIKEHQINLVIDQVNVKYHKNPSDIGMEYSEGANGVSLFDLYAMDLHHEDLVETMSQLDVDDLDAYAHFEWLVEHSKKLNKRVMDDDSKIAFSGDVKRIPEAQDLHARGVHINGNLESLANEVQIKVSYRMMPDSDKYAKLNEILDYFGSQYDGYISQDIADGICNHMFDSKKIELEWKNEIELYKKCKKIMDPYSFKPITIPAILAVEYYRSCYTVRNKIKYVYENIAKNTQEMCRIIAEKIYGAGSYKTNHLETRLMGELIVKSQDYVAEKGVQQAENLVKYYDEKEKLVSHPYEFKLGGKKTMLALFLYTYDNATEKRLVDFLKMRRVASAMIIVASIIGGFLIR